MGAREVGPWVGEQKPLGKSPLRGNPSPESTYLPTSPCAQQSAIIDKGAVNSFWRRSYQRPTSAGGGLHGAIVDECAVSTPLLLAALP